MDSTDDDTRPRLRGRYPHLMLYCDETSIDGKKPWFGWGSLWSPRNRSGDFPAAVQALRDKHQQYGEIHFSETNPRKVEFYCDLIDFFFETKWLMFHGLMVPRRVVNWGLYPNKQSAKVYFLQVLLRRKLEEFLASDIDRTFSPIVDPLPIGYRKEHEKIQKITNAILRRDLNLPEGPMKVPVVRDSKESVGIQLCDLMLGALAWARNGANTSSKRGAAKGAIAARVAYHLDWPDLAGSTYRNAWKFNVWVFKPNGTPRYETGRGVPAQFRDIEKWRPR